MSDDGVADLVIEVLSEGQPGFLGEIKIMGAQVNSPEDIQNFLGLKEGMKVADAWLDRLNRMLFESGRFLGWEVIPRESLGEPGKIDLLIVLHEHWQAPPLSEPLTPEKLALLKVAEWLNTKLGEDGDLVFSLKSETEDDKVEAILIINQNELGFSLKGHGHEVDIILPKSGELALVASTPEESFYSSFPISSGLLRMKFNLVNQPIVDPFAKSGSINFGLGISSLAESQATALQLLFDPSMVLGFDDGHDGVLTRVIEEDLVIIIDQVELRFEADTGRFLSLEDRNENQAYLLTGKIEEGASRKMKSSLWERSQRLENWTAERARSSLAFITMFFLGELNEALKMEGAVNLPLDEITAKAVDRTLRWAPMATFLGDVIAVITDELSSFDDDGPGEPFSIPADKERMAESVRAGQITSLAVGMSFFDALAKFVEPGSWPDLVAREALLLMDGNTRYFQDTLETLLEDPSMGPIGCVVCANLLNKIEHPAASKFISKAEGQLDLGGFEKDWTLLLNGSQKEGSPGWKLIKTFQHFDEEKLNAIFSESQPALVPALVDLAEMAMTLKPETEAAALKPAMEALWEAGVEALVREAVAMTKKELPVRWDPKLVAAALDGEEPLYRGAVRYAEMMGHEFLNRNGLTPTEQQVTNLMAAIDMVSRGKEVSEEEVKKKGLAAVTNVGGVDGVAKIGFTREQFWKWARTSLLAEIRYAELEESDEFSVQEICDFYDEDPFLQQLMEFPLYTIQLNVRGGEEEEKALARGIRERIVKAGPDMNAIKMAFEKEAREYSQGRFSKDGGNRGWVRDEDFNQEILAALAKIKDGGMSPVLNLGDEMKYLMILLVPEGQRRAPLERVKDIALFRAYRESLLRIIDVEIFEEPDGDKEDLTVESSISFQKLLRVIAPEVASQIWDDLEEGDDKDKYLEDLPVQTQVSILAERGDVEAIYRLGTFAERGILPEENGLDEAVKLYLKAVEKSSVSAMLRLAELHRIGRGVEKNAAKANEWREKAFTAFAEQSPSVR